MERTRQYLHDKIDRAGEEQLRQLILWADCIIK